MIIKWDVLSVTNGCTVERSLTFMTKDMNNVPRATKLLFISKYMERMADHAVNIAELVIFMVEGKIIRYLKTNNCS